MDTNKFFSLSRIGMVMKRDLMENWKTNLYRFLGPYAVFLLVMVLGYMNGDGFGGFVLMVQISSVAFVLIGSAFYASYIMEPMRTQQMRTSYLMLPATMLEKFIARALFVTLGFFLGAFLALLLAEATRFLFLPLFDLPDTYYQSVLPCIWEDFVTVEPLMYTGEGADESYLMGQLTEIGEWMYALWIHSFFVLGGCYWYKHAFWKTLCAMLLVSIVGGILLVYAVEWVDAHDYGRLLLEWIEENLDWITITGMLSFGIALLGILVMFNWWLGYKVFARSQVIKPKFRLL